MSVFDDFKNMDSEKELIFLFRGKEKSLAGSIKLHQVTLFIQMEALKIIHQ